MNERYAIIDIESTGGLVGRDRITEIGIVLMEEGKVVDTYSTLVNPERSIPEFVSRITGITDEMVASAPKFYEVARDVVEWTEGAYFVAHNVDFDYRFIRAEFEALGYTFTRRKLCTVKLTRKFFPGLKSYSLGKLIKHFNIRVNSRHRALDDAIAAAELFKKIYAKTGSYEKINRFLRDIEKHTRYPEALANGKIEELPEECGLYYFYDKNGDLIYIGKSRNIKKRIRQHFSKNTSKAEKLRKRVHDVDFKITGSELLALLLESEEIKRELPEMNRAQRTRSYPFALVQQEDARGFPYLDIQKTTKAQQEELGESLINTYGSLIAAKNHLKDVFRAWELCTCIGDRTANGGCIELQLGYCLGAGKNLEFIDNYRDRFQMALSNLDQYFHYDFIVSEPGVDHKTRTLIGIKDRNIFGFCQVDPNTPLEDPKQIYSMMTTLSPNKEVNRIAFHYLAGKGRYHMVYNSEIAVL